MSNDGTTSTPFSDDTAVEEMYRHLLAGGVPESRLRAAGERGGPRSALAESRLMGDGPRLTLADVAARSELSGEDAAMVLDMLGITPPGAVDGMLTEADLRAVQLFARVRGMFGDAAAARFGRVAKLAVSRVAEAAVAMYALQVEDPLLREGASQLDITHAAEEGMAAMALVPELMDALFQRQAVEAIARTAVAHGADASYETITTAVGFADLVGSTSWSQAQSPRQLGEALGEFERLAHGVLGKHSRLVKSIGDEVMFVAPTPDEACRVSFDLLDALANEPRLPSARVGLAYGRAVALDGDVFGTVVNLAARLVAQAEPGQVLVDPALADAIIGELRLTPLEGRPLAGFDAPVAPVRVQRGVD